MQTILETNPCQGIRNPCSNANFGFEILRSRINLSLRDHWDLFSNDQTIAQKICTRCKPRQAVRAGKRQSQIESGQENPPKYPFDKGGLNFSPLWKGGLGGILKLKEFHIRIIILDATLIQS